jgi:hypothetical protein
MFLMQGNLNTTNYIIIHLSYHCMHHPPFACVIFLLHLSDLSFPMLDVISYECHFGHIIVFLSLITCIM